ncbi:MAG: NAD-dependent epimerase/dehydratase family protein [Candidatus Falkowbacteria bacterium]
MANKKTILILGGDGYLGWSLSLAFAARSDDQIVIVDNFSKRKWEKSVHAQSLVKIKRIDKRIKEYERLYRKNNLSFVKIDLKKYKKVLALIKKYRPDTIINAAQQPSAPFSMISPNHAMETIEDNTKTNLNVLWAVATIDKNIKYIKLGSVGSYLGIEADFIPKNKVDLEFKTKQKIGQVLNSWLPMQATDFYHQSKIFSFLISDLCCKLWGLKVVTVQQSTIFGATIPENQDLAHHSLSTRFNYDQVFGTVLNRFVCQAAIGHLITVYGDGTQTTGLISLSNAVDNFMRLAELDLKNGEHLVEHNYTHKFFVNEIANILTQIKSGVITNIANPRAETKSVLNKEFEFSELIDDNLKSRVGFMKDLNDLLNFATHYKNNINGRIISPTINWKK